MRTFTVYILASRAGGTLYVGVTNNLPARLDQHLSTTPGSSTGRYNVRRLVWYETFSHARDAIDREKQIKRWRREKKASLINEANPSWHDLAADL